MAARTEVPTSQLILSRHEGQRDIFILYHAYNVHRVSSKLRLDIQNRIASKMGRRLRRFRHFAQQVVTVTRRLFSVCKCCGHVELDTRKDLVPITSIIAGNIAAKNRQESSKCLHRVYSESPGRLDEVNDGGNVCQTSQAITVEARQRFEEKDAEESKITKVVLPVIATSTFSICSQIVTSGSSIYNSNTMIGLNRSIHGSQIPRLPTDDIPVVPGISSRNGNVCQDSACKTSQLRRSGIVSFRPSTSNSPSGKMGLSSNPRIDTSEGLTQLTDVIRAPDESSEDSPCHHFAPETFESIPVSSSSSLFFCQSNNPQVNIKSEMSLLTSTAERVHSYRRNIISYRSNPVLEFQPFGFLADPSKDDVSVSKVSRHSQKISLNLPLSDATSASITSFTELKVEFAITEVWHTIHPIDWTVQKTLSRGKFSTVQLAMLGEHNKQICLKTTDVRTSQREAELLIECQSEFVVKLCAVLVQAEERYICMYSYELGDLWRWMRQDNPRNVFGEPEAIWITAYLLTSIQYLHERKIIHLDVKPANILIDDRGYPMLTDFGSAMRMRDVSAYKSGISVTPAYASPEMLQCKRPDRLADLWGTVSIFYEIIKGNPPCLGKTVAETEMKITLGITPDVSELSPLAQDFVTSQLQPLRDRRLGYTTGASAVMKHRIFRNINWDIVKYGSRYENSPILELLKKLKIDEEESAFQVQKPNFERNNNRWELWSSSSGENTEDEFEIPFRRPGKKLTKWTEDDCTAEKSETNCPTDDHGDSGDDVKKEKDHVT